MLLFMSFFYFFAGKDGTLILVLGNCDGTLYFFEIIATKDGSNAKKVGAISVDFKSSTRSSNVLSMSESGNNHKIF